jgi:hypothetical protein
MPERSVAFLDILGFKNYTLIDPAGAAQLLLNYHEIINTKLADMVQFPAQNHTDPGLQNLALEGEVGSFETFLPFSDSVFVISNQPDLLIRQVSRFLIDSFQFTSGAFAHPENPTDPTAVTITELSLQGVSGRHGERWFPLLFRGGISFGDVLTPKVTAIDQGRKTNITNLAGRAVVNAVSLEKTGKGPRLFCRADFYNLLSAQNRNFMTEINGGSCHELLWPAFVYHESSQPHVEINHFTDLFLPAANLWRAFRQQPEVEPHYREFLKLIVRSAQKWFNSKNSLEMANQHIEEKIVRFGLQELKETLLSL